jgi:hypothetical protein
VTRELRLENTSEADVHYRLGTICCPFAVYSPARVRRLWLPTLACLETGLLPPAFNHASCLVVVFSVLVFDKRDCPVNIRRGDVENIVGCQETR